MNDVDIADAQALRAIIRQHAPRYIVNAAAYTAVDKAELEPLLAHAINATAPGIMAEEAKALGATLVHYSTDYVFNGSKKAPYVESDMRNPLGVYGKSKAAGEVGVTELSKRLKLHKNNAAELIEELYAERDKISDIAIVYQTKDEGEINVYWATSPLLLCLFAAYLDISAKAEIR
jgi:dTDP-4-dehydrorhamnose reductase